MKLAPHSHAKADLLTASPSSAANPGKAYIDSLGTEVSRRVMVSPLNKAAQIVAPNLEGPRAWLSVPWERLTAPAVRLILSQIKGSPSSRNKALSALKGVSRMAWEMQLMETEEYHRIRALKGDSGSREPAGRSVPIGETSSLLKTCAADSSPSGARDAAMISLAASTGARRAEIAGILISNLDREEDRVSIRVLGKGNRERTLFVLGNAKRALDDWLQMLNPSSLALFCMIRKGGNIDSAKPLSPVALDQILAKRSEQAGIPKVKWHDFRRTTASDLLDAGADIATVASILGHASVQTTARYDRRGERARIKAVELISIPYFKRA